MFRSHLEIPHEQWPGKKIYVYCPDCDAVFAPPKGDKTTCPDCRKASLNDIFVEMSAMVAGAWSFFDRTRFEDDPWLFRHKPDGEVSFFATALAMALYGELRCYGFDCPWPGTDDEIIDSWVKAVLKYVDPATGLIDCSGLGGFLWYGLGPHMSLGRYVSGGLQRTISSRLCEKHNSGVVQWMATFLLELPITDGTAWCNWRLTPLLHRGADGSVTVNEVTYEV